MRLTGLVAVLCVIDAASPSALGQQTVDLGSIGGRVTDQTGAVVADAQVTDGQTHTDETTGRTTDQEGRFRPPYFMSVRTKSRCDSPAFRTVRGSAVPAGAAFELPVTLNVSGIDTSPTVTADAMTLEGARTQIAATVAEAEVCSLPMNGRNFQRPARCRPL